ncbi:MAG TPA: hypothetical protein VMU74_08765 [Gaiellaceae bacterium]|nr:hypothetical protein [Gaiellaceae bacterium]
MGAWYWIGVAAGLGAAAGVLLAGALRVALVGVAVLAAVAGAALGYGIDAWQPGGWGDIAAGVVGSALSSVGAFQVVRGALRRGGTRGGTAVIVAAAALVTAGLAWVPVVGYLEAIALLLLAVRLRRRAPETYAGLRTLAKD